MFIHDLPKCKDYQHPATDPLFIAVLKYQELFKEVVGLRGLRKELETSSRKHTH